MKDLVASFVILLAFFQILTHFFSLFILLSLMDILASISFQKEYPKRN